MLITRRGQYFSELQILQVKTYRAHQVLRSQLACFLLAPMHRAILSPNVQM